MFVAVRREIRWGDLAYMKTAWEEKQKKAASGIRIKREDSDMSVEVYDEEPEGHGQGDGLAQGHRVSYSHVLALATGN